MEFEALCKLYEVEGPRQSIKTMIKLGHRHSLVVDAVNAWALTLPAPDKTKNVKPAKAVNKIPAKAETKPEPVALATVEPEGLSEYYNPTKWPAIDYFLLPPAQRKEYDDAKKTFIECKRLHTALEEYSTDTERAKAALAIVLGMRANARTLARCRFVIKNGELPAVATGDTLDETNAIAVYEALRNIRTYVSRYRNKPGKETLYSQYAARESYLSNLYEELKKAN
jgi:hypothetical protein